MSLSRCNNTVPRNHQCLIRVAHEEGARPMHEKAELDLAAPPVITSLRELARSETECARCPLYNNATQAAPGEGRRHAHLMRTPTRSNAAGFGSTSSGRS